jgi:hypothetical protein
MPRQKHYTWTCKAQIELTLKNGPPLWIFHHILVLSLEVASQSPWLRAERGLGDSPMAAANLWASMSIPCWPSSWHTACKTWAHLCACSTTKLVIAKGVASSWDPYVHQVLMCADLLEWSVLMLHHQQAQLGRKCHAPVCTIHHLVT